MCSHPPIVLDRPFEAPVFPSAKLEQAQVREGLDEARRWSKDNRKVRQRVTKFKAQKNPYLWRVLGISDEKGEALYEEDSQFWVQAWGILAEMALSIITGLVRHKKLLSERVWTAIKPPDLGKNFEVRWSQTDDGPMMVYGKGHGREDPDGRYVGLAVGYNPFEYRGWMNVDEVKQHPEWRHVRDGLETWHVPQIALHQTPLPADA